MRLPRWPAVMVAAVAISVLAAPPAGAGMGSPPMRLTISKTKGGPYSFFALNAKVNAAPKDFFVKVADKTEHRQDGLLEDVSAGAGFANFKIRWFRGDENITSDVQGRATHSASSPGSPRFSGRWSSRSTRIPAPCASRHAPRWSLTRTRQWALSTSTM